MSVFNLALAAINYAPPLVFNGTTLNVSVVDSLQISGGALCLVGDTPNPGSFLYYGTNTGSLQGWFPLPDSLTGAALYSDITGLSGWALNTFATITNLALSGSNLYVMMTGMSGQANTNYATVINLGVTGSALYQDIVGLSGQVNSALTTTGQTLYQLITGLSGIDPSSAALAATGSQLYQDITGFSGVYNASFGVFVKSTGSFTIAAPVYRYLWSGVNGAQWTGTMPSPGGAGSGVGYEIKNISTGASLTLSGTIDYQTNYTLYGTSAINLVSNNESWIIV